MPDTNTKPVTLTDDEREALANRLAEIRKAQAKLTEAMKPFATAHQVLQNIYDELLDHLPDIEGYCETCSRRLFAGEQGFRYEDGPILCTEHAPTWADIKRDAEDTADAGGPLDDDDDRLRHAALLVQCRAREAAGTLDEKVLHTL